mmetsp:Transcript_12579/g.51036  ORF Transcript_12579/g.51036 Transcript_12579/m.51036 type:complete len:90 (+) Transcript_12579:165-434(+)
MDDRRVAGVEEDRVDVMRDGLSGTVKAEFGAKHPVQERLGKVRILVYLILFCFAFSFERPLVRASSRLLGFANLLSVVFVDRGSLTHRL